LAKFDLTDGLHPSVSNSSKCFCFYPHLIEAFLICPDFIEAAKPYPNAPILLKCVYNFTQNVLPKTLFSWPKFHEGCWNYHIIPVHSRAVFILPSGTKKNGKIIFRPLFCS